MKITALQTIYDVPCPTCSAEVGARCGGWRKYLPGGSVYGHATRHEALHEARRVRAETNGFDVWQGIIDYCAQHESPDQFEAARASGLMFLAAVGGKLPSVLPQTEHHVHAAAAVLARAAHLAVNHDIVPEDVIRSIDPSRVIMEDDALIAAGLSALALRDAQAAQGNCTPFPEN